MVPVVFVGNLKREKTMERDKEKHYQNGRKATEEVLAMLQAEIPEVWERAEVVGAWVWISFDAKPAADIRALLYNLGFSWNKKRQAWQNPCGVWRRHSAGNPRWKYGSVPAKAVMRDEEKATAATVASA